MLNLLNMRLTSPQYYSAAVCPQYLHYMLKETSCHCAIMLQAEDPLASRTILYQMVALYDYTAQGPEDLEFSEGDTIDILGEGKALG